MLELLIKNRMVSLTQQFENAKAEAKELMKNGNLAGYMNKLQEVDKLRAELFETYKTAA